MLNQSKVLITDSDIHVLHKFKQVLADNDYEVFRASTLPKLLLLLKFYSFDLILLDVTIPKLDYIKIIESIKKTNPHTAIITSNDAAHYDDAMETLKNGSFDLLVKPYDSISLLNKVKEALRNTNELIRHKNELVDIEPTGNIYRFMIECSQDIQYILDGENKFTFINKRVETLLGYKCSELIGKHYSEIVYSDDINKAKFLLHSEDDNSPISQNIELRLQHKINKKHFRFFDVISIPIPHIKNDIQYNCNQRNKVKRHSTFVIAHDVTYRKKVEQLAHQKASYDHLTSLPNIVLFNDRLNLAIANAKRDKSVFAIMYLDLDGFKGINDSYGHHVGDRVLQEMSVRMQRCLRESDTLARVGGDEFTMLFPHVSDVLEISFIANKLIKSIKQSIYINKKKHILGASIGVALYPENGQSHDALIRAADKAMYSIKSAKKGEEFYQATRKIIA